MNCVICKMGETASGMTTVSLTRGESTILVKNVPAQICQNCGEYYLSDEVSAHVMELAEHALQSNAEVEVIAYAA
ncbi:MAG: hypothetical protein C9356_19425 [Oleiphilus sp.]|nr:MAG: hypothetical protein C9356_19425 [Oleiphilus sp.]